MDFVQEIKDVLLNELRTSDSSKVVQRVNKKMTTAFHTHTHILYDIRTILGTDEVVYMEVGSFLGSSASTMLQHPLKTHIVCVDPLDLGEHCIPGHPDHAKILFENLDYHKKGTNNDFEVIKSKSNNPFLIEELQRRNIKVDILFIDGDHSMKAVIQDFFLLSQFVKRGGFIVIDDYLDGSLPEVKQGVDKVVQFIQDGDLPYEIFGLLPNLQNAPPAWSHLNEFIIYKQ